MKLQTDSLIRRVTGAPPNFNGKTPFGWINLLTSLSPCRKISNTLTYEVLIGLLLAILLIGGIFVFINNVNFSYIYFKNFLNIVF